MNGKAIVTSLSLVFSGCEGKEVPICPSDLASFVKTHPDSERIALPELQMIQATMEDAGKLRNLSSYPVVDLRDPKACEKYSRNPKLQDLLYVYEARLNEDGSVDITEFDPEMQLYEKEHPDSALGVPMAETLYSVGTDELSGRKILRIEQGNLLRHDEQGSKRNALYTTTVDLNTGLIVSLDDEGFSLSYDEKGDLIQEKERYYRRTRTDAIAFGAVSDMKDLGVALEAIKDKTRRLGDVSCDVSKKVSGIK